MTKLSNIRAICKQLNKEFDIDLRVKYEEWEIGSGVSLHLDLIENKSGIFVFKKQVGVSGKESKREYKSIMIDDFESEIIMNGIMKSFKDLEKKYKEEYWRVQLYENKTTNRR